jgi:uncharacterized cupredoxin-like copper-binding protein
MVVRLSGLEADRPAAQSAVGARYYTTDTETIFVSHGQDWHVVSTLDIEQANGEKDGTLDDRPSPESCIGVLYTDNDGVQYEAFPTAWATVNSQSIASEPDEGAIPLVQVVLGAAGFDIVPTPASVSAGPLTFIVQNAGGSVHECLILQTTQMAAEVIAAAVQGGTLDESQYDVIADSGDIPAGNYTRFDVQLNPAHYVLVCNEAGHAHLGMAADFDTTLLVGSTLLSVSQR